jgi:uncharacterized protein
VIVALAVEARADVDRLADLALAHGGAVGMPPQDHGFMFTRSIQDPDGHILELFWMDPAAIPG